VVVGADGDVYVAASGDQAIGEFRRDPATSVLTQPAGRPSCISRDGTASSGTGKAADCTHAGLAFKQPLALALAPDARDLLAVDLAGHALWNFPRGGTTGVLNIPWCVSPVSGVCEAAAIHGMKTPYDVAVAPDGRQVYVASTTPGAVAVLTRTAAGTLIQPPMMTAGGATRYACVSNDGGDGCVQGRSLDGASALAVASDGRDVYVAASASGAIDAFARDPDTGGLHQLDGTDGCVSYDGAGGVCATGELMAGVHNLVVSPDGRNVYAVSENHGAVLTFDREPLPTVAPPPPRPAQAAATQPAATTPVAPAAPRITAFTASPRRFKRQTRLRLTLTTPAAVKITVTRRGHRRAARTLVVGPATRSVRVRLSPGRYVAKAIPIDAKVRPGAGRSISLVSLRP
jgi:DNA-binding beta-propeller fold protein YncE